MDRVLALDAPSKAALIAEQWTNAKSATREKTIFWRGKHAGNVSSPLASNVRASSSAAHATLKKIISWRIKFARNAISKDAWTAKV